MVLSPGMSSPPVGGAVEAILEDETDAVQCNVFRD